MPAPKWLFLSFYSMWCFRWALLLHYDYFSHVTQLFARIKRQTRNADSHSSHFVAPWSDVSLVSDVGSVEGLAYHKGWDTLYWTSSTTSTITRQTVDQSQAGAISRQAVVTLSEEDHPHVLALDECQRSVVIPIMHFSPLAHASVTYMWDFSSEYYLLGIWGAPSLITTKVIVLKDSFALVMPRAAFQSHYHAPSSISWFKSVYNNINQSWVFNGGERF